MEHLHWGSAPSLHQALKHSFKTEPWSVLIIEYLRYISMIRFHIWVKLHLLTPVKISFCRMLWHLMTLWKTSFHLLLALLRSSSFHHLLTWGWHHLQPFCLLFWRTSPSLLCFPDLKADVFCGVEARQSDILFKSGGGATGWPEHLHSATCWPSEWHHHPSPCFLTWSGLCGHDSAALRTFLHLLEVTLLCNFLLLASTLLSVQLFLELWDISLRRSSSHHFLLWWCHQFLISLVYKVVQISSDPRFHTGSSSYCVCCLLIMTLNNLFFFWLLIFFCVCFCRKWTKTLLSLQFPQSFLLFFYYHAFIFNHN